MRRHAAAGLTVVELLIAAVTAGIVLAIVAAFFVQHLHLTRQTQARHEVETKAKAVAELVAQDLQIAGSRVVFNNGVSNDVPMPCNAAGATKCVSSITGGTTALDDLRLFDATSLRQNEPCRRIDYRVTGAGVLQRSEIAETGMNCGAIATAPPNFGVGNLADHVLAFDIGFTCADETTVDDPGTCYAAGSFPRQATIRVQARSAAVADISADIALTTQTPNLRY